MTLRERIRDRYGWVRSDYPETVAAAIAREPSHAETFDRMRRHGLREFVGRGLDDLKISALFVPMLTPYEGFGKDFFDIVASYVGMTGAIGMIRAKGGENVRKLGATLSGKDPDLDIAAHDLETRIETSAQDLKDAVGMTAFGSLVAFLAYDMSSMPSPSGIVASYAILGGLTALCAAAIIGKRRRMARNTSTYRDYLLERKEIEEERRLLAAKDVTPRTSAI